MSLRSAVALEQGMDQDRVAAAAAGQVSSLTDHERAILAIANAFLDAPAEWSSDDWQTVTSLFSEDEVAEIVLRMTQFSRNKVRVVLGLDVDEIRIRPY